MSYILCAVYENKHKIIYEPVGFYKFCETRSQVFISINKLCISQFK